MSDFPPRQRMVYAAAQSVRERGVSGTSLRDVVTRADAPRGSLQHYFPEGKDQLIVEALQWSGEYAGDSVSQFMATARAPTPSGLFRAMVRQWRTEFHGRGYLRGCPLAAATADTVADDDRLREVVRAAFEAWLEPVRQALRSMGVPAARARSLALLMISSLEGAIALARARHDDASLAAVVREVGPLLDAAVE